MARKPLPPEREVDCACATPLSRRVLSARLDVAACMRCGAVAMFEAIVDEPRPHDVRWLGNLMVEVDAAALAWVAAWPRAAEEALLPPSLRARDAAELAAAEQAARAAQQGWSQRERFLRAGFPSAPPPPLPFKLTPFAETWRGLQLDEGATFDQLVGHAGIGWAAPFAHALLGRRPAIAAELAALVRGDLGRRAAALFAIEKLRLDGAEVVAALGERIAAPPEPRELYPLLGAVDALGAASRPLAPALRALAARIGDRDYYLRKRVEDSAKRLL